MVHEILYRTMKIKYSGKKTFVIVLLSLTFITGMAVLVWLNLGFQMQPVEAEDRIRLLMSRAVTNNYVHLFNENNTLDFDTGIKLQQELRAVNDLEVSNIEIKKLVPDYLLRPHQSTFIAKADVGNTGDFLTRYFWLSYSNIDRETSHMAWLFAL